MSAARPIPADPPPIEGVRRSRVSARGIDFLVTEAGPEAGRPVLLLHGWPQHHYAWRHLLADPPEGLRLIAPDLPGYGWSGPAPHRWYKEEVAHDLLAMLDAMGIGDGTVLVGHDWGGFIGHLLVLEAPERFDSYLALNIAHPWNTFRTFAPHAWRFALYQPLMAFFGVPLMQRTRFIEKLALTKGVTVPGAFSPEEAAWFGDRYRDPVCARTARDTYRTFLLRELPQIARETEERRATVPIRCVFGVDDMAIHVSMASPQTALADDYTLEKVNGCGHFIADEMPALVRERLIGIAAEFPARAYAAPA
jgi:pimeloyl-ACP methyl ester carboxylesterase